MIGTMEQGFEIIAAVPQIVPPGTSHFAVTAVRTGHRPAYVTWITNGQGVYVSAHYFTAHDLNATELRGKALADMLWRAGYASLVTRELESV